MNLDLEALETSFDLVAPHGDELMDVFYARLFEAAPTVKPLFAGTDLKRQKTMLPRDARTPAESLRDLDAIVPSCMSSVRGTSPTAPSRSTIPWSAACSSPRWPRSPGLPGRRGTSGLERRLRGRRRRDDRGCRAGDAAGRRVDAATSARRGAADFAPSAPEAPAARVLEQRFLIPAREVQEVVTELRELAGGYR